VGLDQRRTVQRMLAHAASEIAAGRRDVVLLVAPRPSDQAAREGRGHRARLDRAARRRARRGVRLLRARSGFGRWEARFRRTRRRRSRCSRTRCAQRRESIAQHSRASAALWSRFSHVAANNRTRGSRADAVGGDREPSETNRLVAFPYTKFLVANMVVDLGAALIVCRWTRRAGTASRAMRWIFPHACTDVFETTRRRARDAARPGRDPRRGRRALALAGVDAEQVAHVDLYSCFPSAVQIAAAEVGFAPERDLTVTGGLTFAGGPFNSYVMHSSRRSVADCAGSGQLRRRERIGGYMSKHAWACTRARRPRRLSATRT
jgi:acetyl-CoA acetyltransferase